ncbi:MAG TPA: alkaline phosphatase family protein, partial [Nitrososphaera sp.]|nr:alkaline phosphatase family protein [Nitrososphaera sp.]
MQSTKYVLATIFAASLIAAAAVTPIVFGQTSAAEAKNPQKSKIQHVVVIFQENVSYDHYFATYPNATNPHGEPAFK